jgi:hypothetical protein
MEQLNIVVDIPSTIAVALAFAATLISLWYAWRFSRTVGGELGGAFKFVMIGIAVFSITRVDDVVKVSGTYAKMGIDYSHVLWAPHHITVLVGWGLIAYGFYRMAKAFTV